MTLPPLFNTGGGGLALDLGATSGGNPFASAAGQSKTFNFGTGGGVTIGAAMILAGAAVMVALILTRR